MIKATQGSAGLDAYLNQFTPMEAVDTSPRDGLFERVLITDGVTFSSGGNITSTSQVQRALEGLSGREATDFALQATIAAANDLTVLHVMRENGLIETTDSFGWTTNSVGIPLPPRSVGCFSHPILNNFFRGTSQLESSINQLLGAQPETGGLVNRQVEDRIVDIREARQAFDAVIAQDNYAEIAEVVRQHRERVFGDPRLGGVASLVDIEVGGVPDPADPRYLDYI